MKGDKFAVIEHDRTQYIVVPGSLVDVEKLNIEEGTEYSVDSVLLIKDGDNVLIGKPTVKGAKVVFEVKLHGRDNKVVIYRYKAKSRYRRTRGHRQEFTRLFVKSIEVDGKVVAKAEGVKSVKSTKTVVVQSKAKNTHKKAAKASSGNVTKAVTKTKSKSQLAKKVTKKVATKKTVKKPAVKKPVKKSVGKKPVKKATVKKSSTAKKTSSQK